MKGKSVVILKVFVGIILFILVLLFIVPVKFKEKSLVKFERLIEKSNITFKVQHEVIAFPWPEGKNCAVSITFDDAVPSQVDKLIPILDEYGVKATFYVLPNIMKTRLNAWKKAAKNGHDIGNHSIIHPCSGNFKGLIKQGAALENYTLDRMHLELDSANKIIKDMLGVVPVSFAYPCGQSNVGRDTMTISYVPLISSMFETGRGYPNECTNDPIFCDMSQLEGIQLDGKSFHEIKKLLKSAKSQGSWLILVGHKINGARNASTRLSNIRSICKYSKDPSNDIWIDNVHNIASYIINKRRKD